MRTVVLLCTLACAFNVASALRIRGTASDDDGFAYVGKFCFDNDHEGGTVGEVSFDFEKTLDSVLDTESELKLFFYDDEPTSWPAMYNNPALSCAEKLKHAKCPVEPCDYHHPEGYGVHIDLSNATTFTMTPKRIAQRARPRFWYFVLANCESMQEIKFEGHVRNVQSGHWNRELGSDQQGLNSLYVGATIIFTMLCGLQLMAMSRVKSTQGVHPIVKLLLISLVLQALGVMCLMISYINLVRTGWMLSFMRAVGQILLILARLVFMLQLLLIANGWTISSSGIKHRSAIFGAVLLMLLLHIVCLFWHYLAVDPALVIYLYASVPGYIIAITEFIMSLWFIGSVLQSYHGEHDEHKRSLYVTVGVAYFFYFIALPFVVVVSAVVDDWVKEKTTGFVTIFITMLSYAGMVVMLWPSRSNEFFKLNVPRVGGLIDDEYAMSSDDIVQRSPRGPSSAGQMSNAFNQL